ncbi:hypothetical protein CN533_27220 [Priestia megaterium]|uniref:DUF6941 family protein n=1 Tax=Priestia megaterium TaxID=1404 RepID=UPI000BF75856|nr:hypothetical protein [Priestia megaterium]PET68282.1 hypothetical protein CN533_27220 [Priestia megaterium]PFK82635.1 hypothetical protein COJ19_25765 [Priestia megaterium]
MPRVSTFMYCEATEANPRNGQMIINAPMHVFTPAFVPGMFSFSIVFGLLGIELNSENNFRVKFVGPDEKALIDTENLNFPNPDLNDEQRNLPPNLRGMMLNFDFRNVVFRQEGQYKTEVFVNEDKIGEFPIDVKGVESA